MDLQTLEVTDEDGEQRVVDFLPTPPALWVEIEDQKAEEEEWEREGSIPSHDEKEMMQLLFGRDPLPREEPEEHPEYALGSSIAQAEWETYLSKARFSFKKSVVDILKKAGNVDEIGTVFIPSQLSDGVESFGRIVFYNCAKEVVKIAFPDQENVGKKYQHLVNYVREEMAKTLAYAYPMTRLLEDNPFMHNAELEENSVNTICNNAARRCLSTIVSSRGPRVSMKDRRDTLKFHRPYVRKGKGLRKPSNH
jgi:hypothetical protein